MKRIVLVPLAIALVTALVPASALAKGASEAEILGPGLDDPVSLPSDEAGGLLEGVAGAAGFFPAVFAQSPDPMLDKRPAGVLGPKYTVTYVMPGPGGELDRLVQDLYPFADPAPVSYTEPGQRFWSTERTRGGWFVAPAHLKDLLVSAGLPQDPPLGDGDSGLPWMFVRLALALTAALVLVVLAALRIRNRPGTATTA
jgi:hypothetical protein